jgi:hypothetical protein
MNQNNHSPVSITLLVSIRVEKHDSEVSNRELEARTMHQPPPTLHSTPRYYIGLCTLKKLQRESLIIIAIPPS